MKGGAKMRGSSRNEITKFVEAGATSLLPFSLLILPPPMYSHLSNKRGGWNKRGGVAKNRKSLNVEGVIKNNF